jgi:hypothetical protein
MDSNGESKLYEAMRARMVLPAIPIPAHGESVEKFATIRWQGLRTLPTCVADAHKHSHELLRRTQWRVRRGDRRALAELLDYNPEFIAVRWVREEVLKRLAGDRSLRRRGRPAGSFVMQPLVVVGLVEELMASDRAKNPHTAFKQLESLTGMLYETTKRLYYQALSEPRFRAIFLTFPETSSQLTGEELARVIGASEQLTSGRPSTRTLCETESGPLKVTFEAT